MTRSPRSGISHSRKKNALSRRRLLRLLAGAGLGAALGCGLPGGPLLAVARGDSSAYSPGLENLEARQWAMVIDTRKLTDPRLLEAVIAACHTGHNVPAVPPPQDVKWIWHDDIDAAFTEGEGPPHRPQEIHDRRFLLLCNHCVNPPCVRVCPTGATFRREDGIVAMDPHRCIGCRYCMAACPYGSRSFNFQEPRSYLAHISPAYPPRARGVVEKCTFCAERLAAGEMPLCVEASEGAIVFGDMEDPASPVRVLLSENISFRRKPALGTLPCVYYIV